MSQADLKEKAISLILDEGLHPMKALQQLIDEGVPSLEAKLVVREVVADQIRKGQPRTSGPVFDRSTVEKESVEFFKFLRGLVLFGLGAWIFVEGGGWAGLVPIIVGAIYLFAAMTPNPWD